MDQVRWGILSTAKIGVEKVIPAIQAGTYCRVEAIASRDLDRAREVARNLAIPWAYGSYEELLKVPEIDAVYIPLPNHLHVPWSLKALAAGKHVLCEKPIGLDADEARQLRAAAEESGPDLKVMEAFMYRFHPQWQRAREIVLAGGVGDLHTIQSFFSYHNIDPENIRNRPEVGGGALMDIGCYCISLARFLFGAEPQRVLGIMERDPVFKIDRITSGILDFGAGTSTFSSATQLAPFQRVNIVGSYGRVEIEIPFNAPPDQPCRLWHQQGGDVEPIVVGPADQYTRQADLFSLAVIEDRPVPTPLDDAVGNMKAIDAIVRSAREGGWIEP
jgi:predicted dehydrogenase